MGLGWPYRDRLVKGELPEAFERWRTQLAKETDPQRQKQLRDRLEQWGKASEELKAMSPGFPDVTFDERLSLPSATQPAQILAPGRGHTSGDAVVYLPKCKVLATGDLIAGDTPFIVEVSPYEWIRTLDAVEHLDFEIIVPGHGGVMKGKDGLRLWRDYFRELTAQTEEAVASGLALDAAVEQVSARLVEKFKYRFPPEFAQGVQGNVRAAYGFVRGK
jgi:glyoxylase-like metal-dependent hydrolase (beta-lactamase superfamily II)